MLRVHYKLPEARPYATQDLIHDAIVAGLIQAGLTPDRLLGYKAAPFTFACASRRGRYDALAKRRIDWLEGLTISTTDPEVAAALADLTAEHILMARALSGEMISLAGATKQIIPCPIAPGQACVGAYWMSPLVTHALVVQDGKRYITDPLAVEKVPAGAALSRRLGREVPLTWMADRLAIRTASRTQTDTALRVTPKAPHQIIYIPGTTIPFVISGSAADLTAAWYAGLGSKTRMGFGCWDTQPHDLAPRDDRKGR